MAADLTVIELTERQAFEVSAAEATRLLTDASFLQLVDYGIVEVTRTRNRKFALRASQFVGSVRLRSGLRIVVREKLNGALAGLLPWASPSDVRELLIESGAKDDGALMSVLVKRFLDSLEVYLQHGLRKRYEKPLVIGGSPRGATDIRQTVRLRARGRSGVLAFRPQILTTKLPANMMLALALLCVESLGVEGVVSPELVLRARFLFPFFAECEPASLKRLGWRARADTFERIFRMRDLSTDLALALGYARPLALHAALSFDARFLVEIPNSFFLNLETLFEDAFSSCAKTVFGFERARRPGEYVKPPLFDQKQQHYRATPDLMCVLDDGRTVLFDCKYKTLDGVPEHDDIYQIVAHAEAFHATSGIIVYPGDTFGVTSLGRTRGGIQVSFATVRPKLLEVDVRALFEQVLQPLKAADMLAVN